MEFKKIPPVPYLHWLSFLLSAKNKSVGEATVEKIQCNLLKKSIKVCVDTFAVTPSATHFT